MILLFTTLGLTFAACSGDDDEPISTNEQIRGYWIDNYDNFALEIVSTRDYMSQNGKFGNCSEKDNVYQLWYTGESFPKLYVSWTTQLDYFSFFNPDYSWRDKVYISTIDQANLVLEGLDIYQFNRVSKETFESLVNRFNNSGGNVNGDENNGSEQFSSTKKRLVANGGTWYHDSSKSTQVGNYRWNDYVFFSPDNGIMLHLEWQCQRKNNSIDKSIVDAWGTYSIQGPYLLCEFINVICEGNNDINTKYWNIGKINMRKYEIEFFNSGELWLTSNDEYGNLPMLEQKTDSQNSGSSGTGIDHHYPCKSCDESGDCWNCHGSGTDPITKGKCNLCHGSGKCPLCNGKGYIIV